MKNLLFVNIFSKGFDGKRFSHILSPSSFLIFCRMPFFLLFRAAFLDFSRKNSWVFVVLALLVGLVALIGRGNTVVILTVFILQCIADVFVMVMSHELAVGDTRTALMCQLATVGIFFGLTVYGVVVDHAWQYAFMQVFFTTSAAKAAMKVYHRDLPWVRGDTMTAGWIVLTVVVMSLGILTDVSAYAQYIGGSIFATALSTKHRMGYYLSTLVGISLMVLGGLGELWMGWTAGNVT